MTPPFLRGEGKLSPSSAAAIHVTPTTSCARTLAIDGGASVIRYGIVHRLHRVSGRSAGARGKAILHPDGKVVAGVLVPVASFRSGDADRDARAVEILGTFVVFKGETQLPRAGERVQATMRGELTLRGVRRSLIVPLTVEREQDGALHVVGSFTVSLESHGVERPSLLFVKVEDTCKIDLDLVLRDDPAAPQRQV
jgi:polyisoprenoid-binding protein YceI